MLYEVITGEFEPRYEGQRFEFGPFFQYYNQEPDFVYGGYLQYENSKYKNLKWNRNISANLSYNRYKTQDWATAEINIGWSYYSNLQNQFDFGIRYNPGIELDRITSYNVCYTKLLRISLHLQMIQMPHTALKPSAAAVSKAMSSPTP